MQFCYVSNGFNGDGVPDLQVFNERASYHGEIAFDPANGTVLRIAMEAQMPPNELVSKGGMLVEYGPAEIGRKTFICPAKSVSILLAHTTRHQGAYSMSNYQGPAKTFLNDVVFGQYRRFGSETRILTGDSAEPGGDQPASVPAGAPAASPKP